MQKSKTPRRTRPEPERTQPERAWKRAPRPQDGASAEGKHAKGERQDAAREGNGTAPEGNGAGPAQEGPGARSSAYRTLNDAYRLVDEYLRQGQQMAENIWLPFAGNGVPGWPTAGAPERFLRAVGDMTLAWVEAMQGFTSASAAASAQQPSGTAGPFQTVSDVVSQASSQAPSPVATSGPAPKAEPPRPRELGVSVEAKGRVEVSAALTDLGEPRELEVSELLPAKGKAAPIRKVSVHADRARVTVRIVVPDAQPRGRYNGFLLDAETREPRGTLSVVVR